MLLKGCTKNLEAKNKKKLCRRGSLPSAKNKALGKEGFEFFLKKIPLCRVPSQGHSAKTFQKKLFAERRVRGTRQSIFQKKIFA